MRDPSLDLFGGGPLASKAVDVLARWRDVVSRPEAEIPLDEAALLISAAANPGLDVASELARLDLIAARAGDDSTESVVGLLFGEMVLRGDRDTYDDPENSYLDRVVDRRLGIPITLSVLLIEVARRRGLVLEGVGMPGHFLVRDPARPEELIDTFSAGRRLDLAACERLMQQTTGSARPLSSDMLAATGRRTILSRMLANLDHSFEGRQDRRSLQWVSRLRASLPGLSVRERTHVARRLSTVGRFDLAAEVLEDVASTAGPPGAADPLRAEAARLRARLN